MFKLGMVEDCFSSFSSLWIFIAKQGDLWVGQSEEIGLEKNWKDFSLLMI